MDRTNTCGLLVTLILSCAGLTTTARAADSDCAGSSSTDSCIVGVWQKTGGGAVEWMRRNMPPGISIPHAADSGGIIRFAPDGRFWTAPYSNELVIQIESTDGIERYEGNGVAQSAGYWSAGEGRINMCTDTQAFAGTVKAEGAPGPGMPVGPAGSSGPLTQEYTCNSTTLITRQRFPDMPDPMVTEYSRVGASASH